MRKNESEANQYHSEELIELVAKLSRKYTSGESTSISYEKAEQLMEAVLYCIHENDCMQETEGMENDLMETDRKISVGELYETGFQKVMEKTKKSQEKYNLLSSFFEDFGNRNLKETYHNAISGFFLYYDPVFAPQNTIITMDYPVLVQKTKLSGIDAVSDYIDAIYTEQLFLNKLPYDYVTDILGRAFADYKSQFINISTILFRHVLAHALLGEGFQSPPSPNSYERLSEIVKTNERTELRRQLNTHWERLVALKYNGDLFLQNYFQKDLDAFTVELKNVTKVEYIRNVVVV